MIWHHIKKGQGRPLVLLHGIGMNREAWRPVMDLLAMQREVVAFDIPGFGKSPALSHSIDISPKAMVASLAQCLNEMGMDEPIDIAGNSLGGRIMFDAAVAGLARSIVGISPAGLWRKNAPPHIEYLFGAMRRAYTMVPGLADTLLETPLGRTIIMASAVSARGWKIPAHEAIQSARRFAESDSFQTIFEAYRPPFLHADQIHVPCTIAFGDLDMVLPIGTRDRSRAPVHTYWVRLPGCGHVPMWDNPELVSRVILQGTR